MSRKHTVFLASALSGLMLNAPCTIAQINHDAHDGPAMNYHVIDERLTTGGHFVDGGIDTIADGGIEVVIDLRDNPPEGQKEKLGARGIEWINIPVVWTDPKRVDFERFSAAMSENNERKVLVQCQANYRASAMTYLYRVKVDNVPNELAMKDLNAVWQPDGQWRDFIDNILTD